MQHNNYEHIYTIDFGPTICLSNSSSLISPHFLSLSLLLPVSLVPSLPEYHFIYRYLLSARFVITYSSISLAHSPFPLSFLLCFHSHLSLSFSLIAFFPIYLYLSLPLLPFLFIYFYFLSFLFYITIFLFFSSLYQPI